MFGAFALSGPAFAQTTTTNTSGASATNPQAADATGAQVQEIVVTGRRQAIESAIRLKEHADQIVDSVVADQAGKLPDNSVTEVLQRVPGVSITRFAAAGDPDHYSVEGSGVAVRGLTQVNSTLNGRESFSANGGRSLLWEDVPPELMAGVDVYKSSTADQLEGGIGGSINLRTHMPFDFNKPTANGSINYNWGDLKRKGTPGGSILLSDKWDTSIGRIGVTLDAAYSDIADRADTLQVEPYFPQPVNGGMQYIPGGNDWRATSFERKRTGLYEAAQWAPTPELTFFETGFRSQYKSATTELGIYNANGNNENVADPANSRFGPNGGLTETDSLIYTGWNPLPCPAGTNNCSAATSNTTLTNAQNQTTDFAFGADWNPTDRLRVRSAVQFVDSTAQSYSTALFGQTAVPSFGFDVTGDLPVFSVPSAQALADPSAYNWEATMDHREKHRGTEFAWNADANYKLSDDGFLREIQAGVRYADRKEHDDVSAYNWTALTPDWGSGLKMFSTARPGDVMLYSFPHFFQGKAVLPGAAVFPSSALAQSGDIALIHQLYGAPGDTTGPVQFNPSTLTIGSTKTVSAYGMLKFGADSLFGMEMNGNIGLRLVHDENASNGFISEPTGQVLVNGVMGALPGGYIANGGGRKFTEALPSFNIQFLPRRDIHIRFALSRTMSNPSFSAMTAAGSLSLATDAQHDITGASAYIGNPDLKPQLSDNVDLSFEWYLPHDGLVHLALFAKNIHDYISYGVYSEQLPFALPGGQTQMMTAAVTNVFNAGQAAKIKGFEAGVTKFFDFLPAPFDGLGIDANYTYIDSTNPGDLSYDMLGQKVVGLPVDLLSRNNFNVTGMYEKGPWSVRLAYNWRSKYLLTPTGNGTNGTYTNPFTGGAVVYNLPVFSAPYGQLDFGATYKVNRRLAVSVDGQNLTASVAKTLMGAGAEQYGRSWFVADRRVMATLRFSY